MKAAPTRVCWAIKYSNAPRGVPYIDPLTASYLRRDAWAKFMQDWSNAPELARRLRRNRRLVAVRIEIRELEGAQR